MNTRERDRGYLCPLSKLREYHRSGYSVGSTIYADEAPQDVPRDDGIDVPPWEEPTFIFNMLSEFNGLFNENTLLASV